MTGTFTVDLESEFIVYMYMVGLHNTWSRVSLFNYIKKITQIEFYSSEFMSMQQLTQTWCVVFFLQFVHKSDFP